MTYTALNDSIRLVLSAGHTTLKVGLPHSASECIKQINRLTEIVLQAENAIISVSIKDGKGNTKYTDRFLPWEYLHNYDFTKEKVNSYSLGVILFLFLFRRFPVTAEQQLHRHIDYASTVLEEITDGFLEFANDYLTHSLCISSVCRISVSELYKLTCKMLASK